MVSLTQLLVPIALAAVLVFVASAVIHMVIKWHNADYRKLANEDAVRAAINASAATPGLYLMPYCTSGKDMQSPEMQQKFREGPIAFLAVRPSGIPSMGQPLALWFVLTVLVAAAVGYLASRTVPAGASFLAVGRVVGLTTFLAYACGGISNAIWYGKPWPSAIKEAADAFIYGLVTACAFGWLWPR